MWEVEAEIVEIRTRSRKVHAIYLYRGTIQKNGTGIWVYMIYGQSKTENRRKSHMLMLMVVRR